AASIGYASPEGSDEHNQFLSEKRAEAIQIAMSNAFGKRLAIDAADILVIGRGSRLAEADGMIKPPVPPTMKQKYDQQYRNQFKDYRFVVLNVNGVLVLRMSAGQVTPADEQ